jgi:hypothetical protein
MQNISMMVNLKNNVSAFLLAVVLVTGVKNSFATGKDTLTTLCSKHLKEEFISDGQQYQALLFNANETAEFTTTLYGGTTYRVAACSGFTDGNLLFWVYDTNKNLLFTNKDFANAPYWDFLINNTIDCVIEARLDSKNPGSGKALVLIGFKQKK